MKNLKLKNPFAGLSIATMLVSMCIFCSTAFGQYHASSTSTSALLTGLSGVTRVNCDVRSISSQPMKVVVYDGSSPAFHWDWNGYSGTETINSSAKGQMWLLYTKTPILPCMW